MRTFTDTAGREWQLNITVGAVKRVREATDVLLPSLFDDDLTPLGEFVADYIKVVDVLWAVCKPQADAIDINAEQFAESLGNDSLGKATEALVRATIDFFTSPEQRTSLHQTIDKVLATTNQVQILAGAKVTEMLTELDPAQLAQSCLDFATSGQASRELTPTLEPLAS